MIRSPNAAIKDVLESFQNGTVLVIGDVMLDEYIAGKASRISPEAPVPIVEVEDRMLFPGGAANTAANVACLGGTACLIGVVGCDQAAEELRNTISRYRVEANLVEDAGRPTTKKARLVVHHQQVARFDFERRQGVSDGIEELLLQSAGKWLQRADAVVLSDYGKGALQRRTVETVIAMARAAGKPTVVDPKSEDFTRYAGATVVTPNVAEAEHALRRELTDDAAIELGAWNLSEVLGGSALLLTRGSRGMSLFNGSEVTHIAAAVQNVFDVTGAGDTVVAALAISLAAGAPLRLAAELANTAAGIAVRKFGTTAVQFKELLQELNANHEYFNGVLEESAG